MFSPPPDEACIVFETCRARAWADVKTIEIINNTREGIVIFFSENERERGDWGANPSPGCRAKR